MSDKTILHKLPAIGQPNTHTCWVASYQMVYCWKNPSLSEAKAKAEAKQKLYEADLDTNRELYPRQFEDAAIAVGTWPMATKDMRDYERFLWCIEKSPIWCAGDFSGGPHAIVVTGIRTKHKILTVHDPWEIATQTKGTKMEMSFDGWAKTIYEFKASCQMWYLGR